MSFLFGAAVRDQGDLQREYKRSIDRSIRTYKREIDKMKVREKQLLPEIRKACEEGNLPLVKTASHELVATRKHIHQLSSTEFRMRTLSMKVQSMKSTQALAGVMQQGIKAMQAVNKTVNVSEMARILHDFVQQSEIVDEKLDFMDDAVEDVTFGGDDADAHADRIVEEVMAEVGFNLAEVLATAPLSQVHIVQPPQPQQQVTKKEKHLASEQADIEARLAKLKGSQ